MMIGRENLHPEDDSDEDDWTEAGRPFRNKLSYRERSASRREERHQHRRQAKRQRWLEVKRSQRALGGRDDTR